VADGKLDGRVAVITGAASGIGRAIALGFAAEGAIVIAADINADGLEQIASDTVIAAPLDVTQDDSVRALAQDTAHRYGRIDILFNNAGLGGRWRIEELPDGAFERFLAVHLTGALYGLRAVLPIMRAQGYGRVVNMVSRGAEAAAPGWAAYGAAKAGLFELTRVAASECDGVDILVNGMIPGPTRTGMNQAQPGLQEPEAVVPSALWMATLPADGPRGKVFWNMQEYRLFTRPET
jgi:NAD(P)-dependent dehydrogenase (short-subunit alcohol dehydrogenase family)